MMDKNKLRKIAEMATQVVGWYPHAHGDSYGPEATVRGPYFRWFRCSEVGPQYRQHVGSSAADVEFCAAAMNNIIPLLNINDELEKKIQILEERLRNLNEL